MATPDHGLTPDVLDGRGSDITQEQINRIVATVRSLCGWHVWPQREETLTVDTPGDPVVFLPTKHLVDVSRVEIDGREVPLESVTWSQDGMVEIHRVPRGFRRVSVDVKHGYEDADELAAVCVAMVRREAAPAQQYSVGSISVGPPGAATPQSSEWRIVDMHKLGPIP